MTSELGLEVGLFDVVVGSHGRVGDRVIHVAEVEELESGSRDEVTTENVLRESPDRRERHESTTVADNHRLLLDGEERRLEFILTEVATGGEGLDVGGVSGIRNALDRATENGASGVGEVDASSSGGRERSMERHNELGSTSMENESLQLHATSLESIPDKIFRDQRSVRLLEISSELSDRSNSFSTLGLVSQRFELFGREVIALVLEHILRSAVEREEDDHVPEKTREEETHI
ncbi:hypothetical protein PMAYCL1PPCAC_06785, partial [Pristionchus mayeri]